MQGPYNKNIPQENEWKQNCVQTQWSLLYPSPVGNVQAAEEDPVLRRQHHEIPVCSCEDNNASMA